jgi:hypothetical protein
MFDPLTEQRNDKSRMTSSSAFITRLKLSFKWVWTIKLIITIISHLKHNISFHLCMIMHTWLTYDVITCVKISVPFSNTRLFVAKALTYLLILAGPSAPQLSMSDKKLQVYRTRRNKEYIPEQNKYCSWRRHSCSEVSHCTAKLVQTVKMKIK